MPDLLAGTTVKALDTPPTVADFEVGNFQFTATTYGVTSTAGTYVDCGVAFTAPTTGRVVLHYSCNISNGTGGTTTLMTPVVREGTTVGSGTSFLAASDDNSIAQSPVAGDAGAFEWGGRALLVSGLTVGASYNVRLEHRVTGGTGVLTRRAVTVCPAT